jgi:hypothetical protein
MNDERSIECDGTQPFESTSVTRCHGARGFDGFGEAAAHGAERKCGNFALWWDGEAGGLARKFLPAVELHSGFFQEFGGETQVFGAVNTPEPELFFIPLQKIQTLFQFLHGAIKGAGEEIDGQSPGMAGVIDLNTNAIFTGLVAFHAAAVVVSNDFCSLGASCHSSHQLKLFYVLFQFEPERLRGRIPTDSLS